MTTRTVRQPDRTTPRTYPDSADNAAWNTALAADIADVLLPGDLWDSAWIPTGVVEPTVITRDGLVATYGTADPAELRAALALADDIEAADRYAAGNRQVAA